MGGLVESIKREDEIDDIAMDWEKEERIKKEREKASKDLLKRETKENKINDSFLDAKEYSDKQTGFRKDPEMVRKSLERLAAVGACFVGLFVAFGIITFAMGGRMNLGQGMATLFGSIQDIAGVVGILTAGVAFVCSIVVIVTKKNKVWSALVTSAAALLGYLLYMTIVPMILSAIHM